VYSNETRARGNIALEDGRVVLADAGNASNIITLLRLIRIVRLMRVLRSVRVEMRVVKKLTPLFVRFFGVLLVFYYIFGVVGMELFAGTMHYSVPAVTNSSYGLQQYYMNRFDNVYLTFMTLFELMVVNNWNIIMEGYVAATRTEWTRLYFIVWFIVSVVVVMNVCAGFVIDAYTLLKPKMQDEVSALSGILDAEQQVEYYVSGLAGKQQRGLESFSFKKLMTRLDSEYMISSMPTIAVRETPHIVFDHRLQQQLGIMVQVHEHSYDQLRRVFGDGEYGVEEDRNVIREREESMNEPEKARMNSFIARQSFNANGSRGFVFK
jgi:hypothetical protein